jgi:hypothetical protein
MTSSFQGGMVGLTPRLAAASEVGTTGMTMLNLPIRRDNVLWSGTGIGTKIDSKNPSVCRPAKPNNDCTVAINSIAKSLWVLEDPLRPVFSRLSHCSITSSLIQNFNQGKRIKLWHRLEVSLFWIKPAMPESNEVSILKHFARLNDPS